MPSQWNVDSSPGGGRGWQRKVSGIWQWYVWGAVFISMECQPRYWALSPVRWRFLLSPLQTWRGVELDRVEGPAGKLVSGWSLRGLSDGPSEPQPLAPTEGQGEWGQPSPIKDCPRVRCTERLGSQRPLIWIPRTVVNVSGTESCWGKGILKGLWKFLPETLNSGFLKLLLGTASITQLTHPRRLSTPHLCSETTSLPSCFLPFGGKHITPFQK